VGVIVVSFAQLGVVGLLALLGASLSSPHEVLSSGHLASVEWAFPTGVLDSPKLFLAYLAGFCGVAVIVNNGVRLINEYWAMRVMREVEAFYGASLVDSFLRLPYEWHLNRNSSDLFSAAMWANHYGNSAKYLTSIACDLCSALAVAGGLIYLEPSVSLAICVIALLAFVLFKSMNGILDRYSYIAREVLLARNRILNIILHGIKDVKVSGQEEALLGRYKYKMSRAVILIARQQVAKQAPAFFLEIIGFVIIVAAIIYLAMNDYSGARIMGTTTLLAVSGWKILPCISKVLGSFAGLRTSWPFVQKGEAYFQELQDISAKKSAEGGADCPPSFDSMVEFKKISFKYENCAEGLENIDLKLFKGQAVGIVGRSGAGKSTLVNVLSGLLRPSSGDILVDGQRLTSDAYRKWRVERLGYVSQFPYICDATLAENVAYGVPKNKIDRGLVRRCCQMASMDFLDSLSGEIDAQIGERGVRLSGGQQQRIAIARALYKDPEIVIFDEATSSLDAASEKNIQNTIYGLKGSVTLVIVAHSLSTVEGCDSVCWLRDGRIHMVGAASQVLDAYRADFSDESSS